MQPQQQAQANFRRNREALAAGQPAIIGELAESGAVFLIARDESLTSLQDDGLWLGSCSVPRAAAREQLKSLQLNSAIACFLDPRHGQHLLVAMEMLLPQQALIAVCPDSGLLNLALHCVDLSEYIADKRLFLCPGAQWPTHLHALLDENPGLPVPGAFVRTNLCGEESVQELIRQAQSVFNDASARRSAEVAKLLLAPRHRGTPPRIVVVSPSRFRLWDDAGHRLGELLEADESAALEISRFDPDRPTSASPLALAKAISEADAILTADTGRADLPAFAATPVPWLSFVTRPHFPSASPESPDDRLIVSDLSWVAEAADIGWPGRGIRAASLPPVVDDIPPAGAPLAIIADTQNTDGVADKLEYSSHRLLWEAISADLSGDPFRVDHDPVKYVSARMQKLGIAQEGFDFASFIDGLLLPWYQQCLARLVMNTRTPLVLHGLGWRDLPEFRPIATGPVSSHDGFAQAVRDCAAIVHVWPTASHHPADNSGRPVLRLTPTILVALSRPGSPRGFGPAVEQRPARIGGRLIAELIG